MIYKDIKSFNTNRTSNINRESIIKFLAPFLLLICSSSLYANNEALLNQIDKLENAFQKTSSEFYSLSENYSATSSTSFSDINNLLILLNKLEQSSRINEAIQLIYNNSELLTDNLHHPTSVNIIQLLLENNDINLANKFYQIIKTEGDDFQLATVNFNFARYHATRQEWKKVIKLLDSDTTELSNKNSDYASLLKGIALQRLKLHRRAEKSYSKIAASSPYYRHAQLNLALTQIRQGWLTNGRKMIHEIIKDVDDYSEDEFNNRLYLVLGYALLQKDYFRSSREVFRKISQTSQYANRALLGLALCAINQKDMESGYNTLSLLKAKNTLDISVDESYLLMTYVYEKVDQKAQVIESSREAMNYYQTRIKNLQHITIKPVDFSQLKIEENEPVLLIQNHRLDFTNHYATSFLKNYRHLLNFAALNKNPQLARNIEQAIVSFDELFQKIIKQLVTKKINQLNSYLNQARYGLARLYDKDGRVN